MERKFNVSNRKSVSSSSSRVRSTRRRPGCIRLFVCPTTGGRLEISVSPRETVLGLKAALARKLRVVPTKITLIYKDKVLKDGCIQDHHIPDESHVTLLPNMEAGLSLHQSDKSIMQALENLTETQVSDFLSGRSPLMLAIRLGENMVFVQLQLSMLQAQSQRVAQPRQNGTPLNPAAAAVLSQTGLSPSAIAEATRCLSQKLHRLHEMNISSSVRPSTSMATSAAPRLAPPPAATTSSQTPPPQTSSSGQTLFQLPPRQPLSNFTTSSMPSPPPSPGAIIDSMKHLGRGVYTGTFQGTLDPSLQDGNGQPRRSVSTILHILSDLLVAAPQCPAPAAPQCPAPAAGQSEPAPQCPVPAASQNEPVPQGPSPVASQGQAAANLQANCQCQAPLPLTQPSSPVVKISSVVNPQDDPENTLLRGKMQRIQRLLAQRKEQRKTRREMSAPYSSTWSPHKVASATVSSSSLFAVPSPSLTTNPSVCMAATAAATTSAASSDEVASHGENSDPSSSYCKPSIEQDSLAV